MGVTALVLVIPPDVGSFVGVIERHHVIADLTFKLANWDRLPALGIAEVIVRQPESLDELRQALSAPMAVYTPS